MGGLGWVGSRPLGTLWQVGGRGPSLACARRRGVAWKREQARAALTYKAPWGRPGRGNLGFRSLGVPSASAAPPRAELLGSWSHPPSEAEIWPRPGRGRQRLPLRSPGLSLGPLASVSPTCRPLWGVAALASEPSSPAPWSLGRPLGFLQPHRIHPRARVGKALGAQAVSRTGGRVGSGKALEPGGQRGLFTLGPGRARNFPHPRRIPERPCQPRARSQEGLRGQTPASQGGGWARGRRKSLAGGAPGGQAAGERPCDKPPPPPMAHREGEGFLPPRPTQASTRRGWKQRSRGRRVSVQSILSHIYIYTSSSLYLLTSVTHLKCHRDQNRAAFWWSSGQSYNEIQN